MEFFQLLELRTVASFVGTVASFVGILYHILVELVCQHTQYIARNTNNNKKESGMEYVKAKLAIWYIVDFSNGFCYLSTILRFTQLIGNNLFFKSESSFAFVRLFLCCFF